MIDGGFTDNTGIGRAVKEGCTHISAIGYYVNDILHLFENQSSFKGYAHEKCTSVPGAINS